jgi:uncharacterized protein YbcV (DUF1398 family)
MEPHVKDVVREMTRASDEERIVFPDVVKALMEASIERYHANLIDGTRTYYMPDDSFEVVDGDKPCTPAQIFSAKGVEQAVRAIQRGEIKYREFCERVAAAGCVGYFVSITGRRAHYYGRTSEYYVEMFPGTSP